MELIVIGSGSSGNCYALKSSEGDILLLEAGTHIKEIKKALDFDLSKVVGCLLSHSHLDHSKSAVNIVESGIDLFASQATTDALPLERFRYRIYPMTEFMQYHIGAFTVMPFPVQHDVPTFGFIIYHQESGQIVFITDTHYVKNLFPGTFHFLIECNYAEEIINERLYAGKIHASQKSRVESSHMSDVTLKSMLRANDLSQVQNIVLLHLSDSNSNERKIQNEIGEEFQKNTFIADKGLKIPLNK